MRFVKGLDWWTYVVFEDEVAAMRWWWLFGKLLRRHISCCGGYFNGYRLFKI